MDTPCLTSFDDAAHGSVAKLKNRPLYDPFIYDRCALATAAKKNRKPCLTRADEGAESPKIDSTQKQFSLNRAASKQIPISFAQACCDDGWRKLDFPARFWPNIGMNVKVLGLALLLTGRLNAAETNPPVKFALLMDAKGKPIATNAVFSKRYGYTLVFQHPDGTPFGVKVDKVHPDTLSALGLPKDIADQKLASDAAYVKQLSDFKRLEAERKRQAEQKKLDEYHEYWTVIAPRLLADSEEAARRRRLAKSGVDYRDVGGRKDPLISLP